MLASVALLLIFFFQILSTESNAFLEDLGGNKQQCHDITTWLEVMAIRKFHDYTSFRKWKHIFLHPKC